MALETQSLNILYEALQSLDEGFHDLPDHEIDLDMAGLQTVMLKVAEKMRDNYPYHHPLYAGQMLKPPHTIVD
jgi:tyrosine decarboxylase/aspartate 1-decarboxylase